MFPLAITAIKTINNNAPITQKIGFEYHSSVVVVVVEVVEISTLGFVVSCAKAITLKKKVNMKIPKLSTFFEINAVFIIYYF